MKIAHLGYAVSSLEKSAKQFEALGYIPDSDAVCDETRHVRIQFWRNGDYVVELVAPLDEKSPIHDLLKKKGSSPYHICYETGDITADLKRLEGIGFKAITKPSPAPAIGGRSVCFLFSPASGLIELVDLENKGFDHGKIS